jgi:hypothetical protein
MTGRSVWTLNYQNLSIERYRVRGANHPTSKSQPPRAKTPRGSDFARACHDGPIAIVRHTAVFLAFAAALSLTNCKGLVRQMWERAMRAGIVAGCTALALLVSSCSVLEEKLIQEGIGTELPVADMAEATRRLDAYLTYLCAQAGGTRLVADTSDAMVSCDMSRYGAAQWSALVSAGFNDIDRRCDGYLAWLASRRRDRNAILSQIHDTRTFTEALLFTTGVGAAPIAIAGLAFGLASNSFTNYYSRLLFEIEKSTVSVLVREKRLHYRETLNIQIAFQPDAVHVLREYLLICTPFYIEDLVNQRTRDSVSGNTPADKGNAEQIRRSIVAGALLSSIPKTPRDPLPNTPGNPQTPQPPKMIGGITDSERVMSQSTGGLIQRTLCVKESNTFEDAMRSAIRQAKLGGLQSGASAVPFTNIEPQIVNGVETQIFTRSDQPCFDDLPKGRVNRTPFERYAFVDAAGVRAFQVMLGFCDARIKGNESGKFDQLTRDAIVEAKKQMTAARKAELTDPTTSTVNDKSYNNISRTCRQVGQ